MKYKIYKDVLQAIMEFSKSFYPNEFSAFLYFNDDDIITDIYILPGTKSNSNSAVIRLDMAPLTFKLKGSVHSHPSGMGYPSLPDLSFFRYKDVNIIAYSPFDIFNFKAYNRWGKPIDLEIIDRKNKSL